LGGWKAGHRRSRVHGMVTALIDSQIELGGFKLSRGTFGIHVYAPTARSPWTKVFSAHLGDPSVVESRSFPYFGGRCGISSWKRGPWEDRISAERVDPRTVAHLLTAGLARFDNHRGAERALFFHRSLAGFSIQSPHFRTLIAGKTAYVVGACWYRLGRSRRARVPRAFFSARHSAVSNATHRRT
jgi:hypothetical protein